MSYTRACADMACRILLLLVLAQACHTVSGCMRRQEGTLPLDDDGTSQDQRSTRQQDINNHVDMNQAQQIQISKDIAMTNLLARSAASTAVTSARRPMSCKDQQVTSHHNAHHLAIAGRTQSASAGFLLPDDSPAEPRRKRQTIRIRARDHSQSRRS